VVTCFKSHIYEVFFVFFLFIALLLFLFFVVLYLIFLFLIFLFVQSKQTMNGLIAYVRDAFDWPLDLGVLYVTAGVELDSATIDILKL
jgi:hypothetical protein